MVENVEGKTSAYVRGVEVVSKARTPPMAGTIIAPRHALRVLRDGPGRTDVAPPGGIWVVLVDQQKERVLVGRRQRVLLAWPKDAVVK